jgi:hypothetical protein
MLIFSYFPQYLSECLFYRQQYTPKNNVNMLTIVNISARFPYINSVPFTLFSNLYQSLFLDVSRLLYGSWEMPC